MTVFEPGALQANDGWIVWMVSIDGRMPNLLIAINRTTDIAQEHALPPGSALFGMVLLGKMVHFDQATIPEAWRYGPPEGQDPTDLAVEAKWMRWNLEMDSTEQVEDPRLGRFQVIAPGGEGIIVRHDNQPLHPWRPLANESLAGYASEEGLLLLESAALDVADLRLVKVQGDGFTYARPDGEAVRILRWDAGEASETVVHTVDRWPFWYWIQEGRVIVEDEGGLHLTQDGRQRRIASPPAAGFGFIAGNEDGTALAWSALSEPAVGLYAHADAVITWLDRESIVRELATGPFHRFGALNGPELIIVESGQQDGEPFNAIWAVGLDV